MRGNSFVSSFFKSGERIVKQQEKNRAFNGKQDSVGTAEMSQPLHDESYFENNQWKEIRRC